MDLKDTQKHLIQIETGVQEWTGEIEAPSKAEAKRIARRAVEEGHWPEGEGIENLSWRCLVETS